MNNSSFNTRDNEYYKKIHSSINKLLNTDASVLVEIVPDVSAAKYYSGAGYFSSLSMDGGVGSAVSYSFEITGSGPLTIKTTA